MLGQPFLRLSSSTTSSPFYSYRCQYTRRRLRWLVGVATFIAIAWLVVWTYRLRISTLLTDGTRTHRIQQAYNSSTRNDSLRYVVETTQRVHIPMGSTSPILQGSESKGDYPTKSAGSSRGRHNGSTPSSASTARPLIGNPPPPPVTLESILVPTNSTSYASTSSEPEVTKKSSSTSATTTAKADIPPLWLSAYIEFHQTHVVTEGVGDGQPKLKSGTPYLLWSCRKKGECGGLGDRINGIVQAFYMSMCLDRVLLIEWEKQSGPSLENFLLPNQIAWNATVTPLVLEVAAAATTSGTDHRLRRLETTSVKSSNTTKMTTTVLNDKPSTTTISTTAAASANNNSNDPVLIIHAAIIAEESVSTIDDRKHPILLEPTVLREKYGHVIGLTLRNNLWMSEPILLQSKCMQEYLSRFGVHYDITMNTTNRIQQKGNSSSNSTKDDSLHYDEYSHSLLLSMRHMDLYRIAFNALFQWNPNVRVMAEQIKKEAQLLRPQSYIGLHIRAGGRQGSWVDPTRHTKPQQWEKFYYCGQRLRQALMKKCSRAIDDMYLASDSLEAKRYLLLNQSQFISPSQQQQQFKVSTTPVPSSNLRAVMDLDIVHIDRSQKLPPNGYNAVWAEFLILSESICLVKSRSGFSEVAAELMVSSSATTLKSTLSNNSSFHRKRCAVLYSQCNDQQVQEAIQNVECNWTLS